MLANQLVGDYVALILINSHPDDLDENPYSAGQRSGGARLEALINALPPPANTADAPPARTLRECTRSERESVSYTPLPEYGSLADIANDVETVEDFVQYVEAQLAWRQDSLTQYPACAEAIEIAWLTSQTAGDIAALFALYFIGFPEDDIPYSEPERQGSGRLGEWSEELRAGDLPDEVMQAIERELGNPGGGNWRRCSVGELETIQNLLPTYQMLEDMAAGIETLDDLVAYSQAQIAWRENLPIKLVHCGEVLEIAWLISENIGDLAMIFAHTILDIPFDESPVYQQVMSNLAGIGIWSDTLPSLSANYESGKAAPPGGSDLPDCGDEEMRSLSLITADRLALYENTGVIETLDESLAFVESALAWREVNWARLPLCGKTFELMLRMSWMNNDTAMAGLLHSYLDVPYDANPFVPQLSLSKERIKEIFNELRTAHAALGTVTDTPSP